MVVGNRLRMLREEKKLSQGDIEKRTGLLRCYISRVENGHTVPAIETLEKVARAVEKEQTARPVRRARRYPFAVHVELTDLHSERHLHSLLT